MGSCLLIRSLGSIREGRVEEGVGFKKDVVTAAGGGFQYYQTHNNQTHNPTMEFSYLQIRHRLRRSLDIDVYTKLHLFELGCYPTKKVPCSDTPLHVPCTIHDHAYPRAACHFHTAKCCEKPFSNPIPL